MRLAGRRAGGCGGGQVRVRRAGARGGGQTDNQAASQLLQGKLFLMSRVDNLKLVTEHRPRPPRRLNHQQTQPCQAIGGETIPGRRKSK